MYDDVRQGGEVLLHELLHLLVVRRVAQVDDEVSDVVHRGLAGFVCQIGKGEGRAAKVQAATPQAIFNATGSDTGTLSGVSAGMTYQINDGTVHSISAEDISDTGVEITGVSAGTIKVVQPETDTTLASDEQTIEVGKAETPDLTVKRPTVIGGKGGVTDSTNAHEYMYSADGETWTEWTACEGEMSGLDEGQYRIRVKASGNILASEYQEFTITAFVPDQETKPEGVSFTADGSDTGILSGLTPGEKYGVYGAGLDSAADSTKTADENGKITLTGLAAGTLSVVKKGNGTSRASYPRKRRSPQEETRDTQQHGCPAKCP